MPPQLRGQFSIFVDGAKAEAKADGCIGIRTIKTGSALCMRRLIEKIQSKMPLTIGAVLTP